MSVRSKTGVLGRGTPRVPQGLVGPAGPAGPAGPPGPPGPEVFSSFLTFGSANTSGPGFRLFYPASQLAAGSGFQLFIAPFNCELRNSVFYPMVSGFNPTFTYSLEWFLNGAATGLQLFTNGSVAGNQPFPCPPSMAEGETLECRFINPASTLNNSPRVHIELWKV